MSELALSGRSRPVVPGARARPRGDEFAWSELVRRLDGVLRGVARRYRLASADVDDVVQTTWLRAVDHVGRLHDPGAIAGWLIVTTRREAMRTLQRGVREVLTDDTSAFDDPDPPGPDMLVIERERRDGAAQRGRAALGAPARAADVDAGVAGSRPTSSSRRA